MVENQQRYAFWLKLASSLSLAVAFLLVLAKTWGWMQTHSVSVLASLIDSSTDLLVSFLSFLAIRYALKPADEDHPFGHGKAEALAALAQALMLTGSALYLLLSALGQFYTPRPLETLDLGIIAMLFSLVMTIMLVMVQRIAIAKTNSVALKADALHYVTDILSNGVVLITLFLVFLGWDWLDPTMAIVVAGYVLFSAWKIAIESLDQLMDKQVSGEVALSIIQAAESVNEVLRAHNVRVRQSGANYVIQVYIDLPEQLSLQNAHHVGDQVRAQICQRFPNSDVLIHEEPVSASSLR
jgi:ferrous-iron efflux pump FieF